MRHAYLGTSEFAAVVLRRIVDLGQGPALVVTPLDRPAGRGRKLSSPAVAAAARELGIDLHQTASVNADESREILLGGGFEAATVCAFGQLIGKDLLDAMPMLNVHPSLLPRWRGAAPIERAIIAGDERTGVCVMRLSEGLDEGPVAIVEEVEVGAGDDYGTLSRRLAALGADALAMALRASSAAQLELVPQAEDGVTYAEKITAAERRVDPAEDAISVSRRVRALTPHIGAHLVLAGGERLGVRDPRLEPGAASRLGVGELGPSEDGSLLMLGCGAGTAVGFSTLQPPGKRWMAAAAFLRGRGVPGGPATGPE